MFINLAVATLVLVLNQGEMILTQASLSYGKQGYSKQGNISYGKTSKQGTIVYPPKEEEEDWTQYSHPLYLIIPSYGGIVPPGELVPLSPSNPVPRR